MRKVKIRNYQKGGLTLFVQQRIRVDVSALPIFFRIRNQGNREMQMIIPCSGISGIADIGDRLALPDEVSFRQTFGISIQVGVVIDESAVSAQLINGRAATIAVKEFDNASVRRCQNGR